MIYFSVLRHRLQMVCVFACAALLGGCEGAFFAEVDLAKATLPVQPLRDGVYQLEGASAQRIEYRKQESGSYLAISPDTKQQVPLHFFGPIAGLYVVQIKEPEQDFLYAVVRIGQDSRVFVADNTIRGLMGELLFERLAIPIPQEGATIGFLTDNAALNWALLQDLIVSYREKLEFELYMSPVQ